MMPPIKIRQACEQDLSAWLQMRLRLWPDHTEDEMQTEMLSMLADAENSPVLLAFTDDLRPIGFLEGGSRKYADGCSTNPVGYIEGWFVEEEFRKIGVGRQLVTAFENWCRQNGLSEIGSDTWMDNEGSITAHKKLGYTEVERLVHFIKKIDP